MLTMFKEIKNMCREEEILNDNLPRTSGSKHS